MRVIISESQYNRLIDNFLTFLFEPHEVKVIPSEPDGKYWVRGEEILAQIFFEKVFFIDPKIWNKISNQFDLNYKETQNCMNIWLEKNYGGKSKTAWISSFSWGSWSNWLELHRD